MDRDYTSVMKHKDDEALVRIVHAQADEYEPEAVAAAESELATRNADRVLITKTIQQYHKAQQAATDQANEPLQTGFRIIALLVPLPSFPGIALSYQINGRFKMARQLMTSTLLGYLLYTFVALVAQAL